MSRRVLLVDSDVDALGAVASALRSRGMIVANASDVFDAVELAFQTRPDVVVVASQLDAEGELSEALKAVPELSKVPVLHTSRATRRSGDSLPPPSVDALISRIDSVAPNEQRQPPAQELKGHVEQMALVDLVQLLMLNRRSGVLTVTTPGGTGELRMSEGEVTDASFRRLEGHKALYRLLAQKKGHFAFVPGVVTNPGQLGPTSHLLMEAMRQADELARYVAELTPNGEALLIQDSSAELSLVETDQGAGVDLPPLLAQLVVLLQTPRQLLQVLDDLSEPDLEVLEALQELVRRRRIRRVPWSDITVPLAPPDQLPVLRSLVSRLSREGFEKPARLLICASSGRMPALAHAVRRIMDAQSTGELPVSPRLPIALATLRLGDGVELDVLGLPGDVSMAPAWPLFLGGATAVVRLHVAGDVAIEQTCSALDIPLVDAEGVLGELDVADSEQVAALIRSALELAAGV